MKKTLLLFLPALLFAFSFVDFAQAEESNNTAEPVLVIAPNPNTSTSTLPDFEITEIITKKSDSDSAASYYATVVNRGADYLLTTDNPLGLAFRNGNDENSANNYSFYSVGVAGENFAKDEKMVVGPLLVVSDGSFKIKAMINPLLTIAEKKYDNNFFQRELRLTNGLIVSNPATSTPPVVKPNATSTAATTKKYNLGQEANLIAPSGSSTAKLGLLMKALNTTKNSQKMTQNMKSFTETLKKQFPKVTTAQLYTINNFVTYGTESTAKLSAKERFALVTAYVKANKKLPNSEADWAKLLALKK